MSAILDLPLSSAVSYINHAIETEQEKTIWELWTSLYPLMATKQLRFKDFKTFKNDVLKANHQYSNKSMEEIEEEMDQVIAAYEGR